MNDGGGRTWSPRHAVALVLYHKTPNLRRALGEGFRGGGLLYRSHFA